MADHLLNIAQAAGALNISRSYLYQLVDQKKIDVYRVGRRCLFSQKMLDDFLGSQLVRANHEN